MNVIPFRATPELRKGFNFYGRNYVEPTRPLRVMIATSIRDVGVDDNVGKNILIEGQPVYLKGVLENLLFVSNAEGPARDQFQIVGIAVDDVEGQDKLDDYTALPQQGRQWIVPVSTTYNGEPLTEMVHSHPSMFRKIVGNKDLKKDEKLRFETELVELAQRLGADVILSDHFMLRFERTQHLMPTINIHPAVTNPANPACCRGKTPTKDILERAAKDGGTRTGAALHFVNDEFDDGVIIADTDVVVVPDGWDRNRLRLAVYQQAKNPLVELGLIHLREHFDYLYNLSKRAPELREKSLRL
ncbi:MAG TPA: formyltransferase family protein [Alphaproteobacteria bacterium]|nr:hypothetical protein [Micavibrio sp.]MBK9562592.1 hypothetical protein [Micavibrio sp.]HQX26492.1 formyltransferase family protein [Alphaproteobacteria bacterium]